MDRKAKTYGKVTVGGSSANKLPTRPEENNEGDWMDIGCELSVSLAQLFGDKMSSLLIHLAALCAIGAHNKGLADFKVTINLGDDISHVVLSYRKQKGDVDSGRAIKIYIMDNTDQESNEFLKAAMDLDKHPGSRRLLKYFDLYRKITRKREIFSGEDELESFVVCIKKECEGDEKFGGHLLEEAILGGTGKDDILQVDSVAFKDDCEVQRELVTFFKGPYIGLPRDFASSVFGKERLTVEAIGTDLHGSYWNALTHEVLELEQMCFRKHFVEGKELSQPASCFREQLWLQYANSEESDRAGRNEAAFQSFLANRPVELPEEIVVLLQNREKGTSPEDMAKYFAELIAKDPNSRMFKLDGGYFPMTQVGRYAFSEEFLTGDDIDRGLLPFRNHLRACLEGLTLKMDVLQKCTFQLEGSPRPGEDRELLDEDVVEFLRRLKLCAVHEGFEVIQNSVKDELAMLLHPFIAKEATAKLFELVSNSVVGFALIAESTIGQFLSDVKWCPPSMQMMMSIDPELDYKWTVVDIMDKCFCKLLLGDDPDLDCCPKKNKRETNIKIHQEYTFPFRRQLLDYMHYRMIRHLGRNADKTREVRMNLAHSMTLVGEHESALELTEGELEYGRILSEGFHHVRGRALLGLGRDEECVEYLVLSCVARRMPHLVVNTTTFMATINIVNDLVCRGKYGVAKMILNRLLTKFYPKPQSYKSLAQYCECNLMCVNSGDNLRLGLVRVKQLALSIVDWFYSKGGSKKEVLEVLKIIHQFVRGFKGDEDLETLMVKFLFAKVYCSNTKGASKKGLQYLLDLHTFLCALIGQFDMKYFKKLIDEVLMEIQNVGGLQEYQKALSRTYFGCKGTGDW